jgi:hypothetical protein
VETRITPVKDFTAHVQSRVKKSITIGAKPRLDRCCGNCMESPKEKRTRWQGFRPAPRPNPAACRPNGPPAHLDQPAPLGSEAVAGSILHQADIQRPPVCIHRRFRVLRAAPKVFRVSSSSLTDCPVSTVCNSSLLTHPLLPGRGLPGLWPLQGEAPRLP